MMAGQASTTSTSHCPQCGRASRGRAFGPSPLYQRCALGHVWAGVSTTETTHDDEENA